MVFGIIIGLASLGFLTNQFSCLCIPIICEGIKLLYLEWLVSCGEFCYS